MLKIILWQKFPALFESYRFSLVWVLWNYSKQFYYFTSLLMIRHWYAFSKYTDDNFSLTLFPSIIIGETVSRYFQQY